MTNVQRHLTIDSAATVNELLVEYPEAVSVFNTFGIDACCGGDATLVEAARRDGADPNALIEALATLIALAEKAQ